MRGQTPSFHPVRTTARAAILSIVIITTTCKLPNTMVLWDTGQDTPTPGIPWVTPTTTNNVVPCHHIRYFLNLHPAQYLFKLFRNETIFIFKIDVSYPDWHSCAPKVQLSLDLSMTILFKDGKNEAVSCAFRTLKQVFCYFKKKFQTYHKNLTGLANITIQPTNPFSMERKFVGNSIISNCIYSIG